MQSKDLVKTYLHFMKLKKKKKNKHNNSGFYFFIIKFITPLLQYNQVVSQRSSLDADLWLITLFISWLIDYSRLINPYDVTLGIFQITFTFNIHNLALKYKILCHVFSYL